MKVIIATALTVFFIFYAFGKLNQYLSDTVYESCMAGRKQSQETCYHYAYEQ